MLCISELTTHKKKLSKNQSNCSIHHKGELSNLAHAQPPMRDTSETLKEWRERASQENDVNTSAKRLTWTLLTRKVRHVLCRFIFFFFFFFFVMPVLVSGRTNLYNTFTPDIFHAVYWIWLWTENVAFHVSPGPTWKCYSKNDIIYKNN